MAIQSGELVNSYKGYFLAATLAQNYQIEKWTLNRQDVLDNQNELYVEQTLENSDFAENQNIEVYIKLATAIDNLNSKISLSPNPTKYILNISAQNNYTVIVSDIGGLKVKEFQMLQNNASIDLSNLANGVYFVTLKNAAESKVYKIVKK